MTLGQLSAVLAVDERDVRENRRLPTHSLVKLNLAETVGEVIVAANDMGDAHVMIVHHYRKHIGRRAVGAQQDHVVQLTVRDSHLALDLILNKGLAFLRHLQAHDRRNALWRFGWIAITPTAIIAHCLASGALRGAHFV